VKACFLEIVNDNVDGVCLVTLHAFGLWHARLKEVENNIDEEVGDASVQKEELF